MGRSTPPAAPSRWFPQRPESVSLARRFVREALAGMPSDVTDTAQLLTSELVTNALLHARTEIEVSARVQSRRVCVRVGDRRPSRGVVPQEHHPYTESGQGLALVELLASRYGVDVAAERKTVWFELWPEGSQPPPTTWRPALPPFRRIDTVVLADLPGVLYSQSRQHRHAMLRELTLGAWAGRRFGVQPENLVTAHDVNNVLDACVTVAMQQQPSETGAFSLRLSVPADITPALLTLRHVLDLAEAAAREEQLLTRPALPQTHAFRQWVFDQIIDQLGGESPIAWTVVPRDASASPSEIFQWEAGQVQASRVPTIAADDGNRIIAANGAAADLLGWQPDDLLGQRLTVIIPEHLRQRHLAAFRSLLLTGRPHILGRSVPVPALHRDGRIVPVRLSIQTQGAADDSVVFVAQLSPRTAAPSDAPQQRAGHRPPALAHRDRQPGTSPASPATVERLSLLADTAEALSTAPDLKEGLRQVGGVLTRRLADWCAVSLLNEHDQLDRICVVHHDPGRLRREAYAGRLPPPSEAERGPLARVLSGAGPLLLTDVGEPDLDQSTTPLDADQAQLFAQLGTSSAIVAPLRARRAVFGALTVARTGGREAFTDEELALVDDLVRSLALGVDNARLYQQTRYIAEHLQHSLLPVLPELGHLQLAARYASSSTTAQIGGDWYDSFVLRDGETALVIGDVTGHDLDAAVTMSQLRSMLRGISVDRRDPPGEVLRRLDIAHHSLYAEATATCLYALVRGPEQGCWQLDYSSAGHPPPLLTTAAGDTCYLEDGAGLLLGVDPGAARPEAREPLPAHSTVLLYTDGLIERRGGSLDDRMALLREHTAALAGEPLDVFCDELLLRLGTDSADDIAVLAARPTPRPRP